MEQLLDLYLPPSVLQLDITRILNEDRLLHLHPHWFIEETKPENNGLAATVRDYDTDHIFSFHLHLSTTAHPNDPADTKAIMRITCTDHGVQELLFFTDHHKTQVRISYAENRVGKQLEEEMLLWIRAIQEYLRLYITTTPRTIFFRLLMNRMILQMNPSQRKICLMITKITVVELLVTIVIVVGYVYFAR
jgi:hypothetical protein